MDTTPPRRSRSSSLKRWGLVGLILCGYLTISVFSVPLLDTAIQLSQAARGWKTHRGDPGDDIAFDSQGRLYWANDSELEVRGVDGRWTTYNQANSGICSAKLDHYDHSIETLAIDHDDQVWIGTLGGGLCVLHPDGSWTTYTEANSDLEYDYVADLAVDRQNRVWAGNRALTVIPPDGPMKVYSPRNSGLGEGGVAAIAFDSQNRLWAGGWELDTGGEYHPSGLSVFDPQTGWTTFNESNSGLVNEDVLSLAIDGQDRVWVGTDGGLSVYHPDGSWTTHLPGKTIWALAVDKEGRIWAGVELELSVYDPDHGWTRYHEYNSGIRRGVISAIAVDDEGEIWITGVTGLVSLSPGKDGDIPQPFPSESGHRTMVTILNRLNPWWYVEEALDRIVIP